MTVRIRAAWRVLTARGPAAPASGRVEVRDDGTAWLVTELPGRGHAAVRLA